MLWAGLPGELHQLVAVLTDEPLLVVAGDVVPHLAKVLSLAVRLNTGPSDVTGEV